jgi:pimeloyl-ACP methyl ester carboxylesterase
MNEGDAGAVPKQVASDGAVEEVARMENARSPGEIDRYRRAFVGVAAMGLAATQFTTVRPAKAQGVSALNGATTERSTAASFALRQIDAGLLNVGYGEAGPPNGPVVIPLHGWPYDIHSFVDVAPLLAMAGYRVLVPYSRGHGTTHFLSSQTVRNGQQSLLAVDVIELMDALKIGEAIVAGYDWGARTACIIAALWPERCKALVSVSGYLIGSLAANRMPLPPKAELQWWYQYYFATNAAVPATNNTGVISQILSGGSPRRSGTLMTPHSIAVHRASTTRITSASSSTITAGGSAWLKASSNMTVWKSGWPKAR